MIPRPLAFRPTRSLSLWRAARDDRADQHASDSRAFAKGAYQPITGPTAGCLESYAPTPAMSAGVTDRLWTLEDLYDAVMA